MALYGRDDGSPDTRWFGSRGNRAPKSGSSQPVNLLVEHCQSLFQDLSVAWIFCSVQLLQNPAAGELQPLHAEFDFSFFRGQAGFEVSRRPSIVLLQFN